MRFAVTPSSQHSRQRKWPKDAKCWECNALEQLDKNKNQGPQEGPSWVGSVERCHACLSISSAKPRDVDAHGSRLTKSMLRERFLRDEGF